ncbi:MAG: DUF327 family protein [Treponema sp.]|jgi:uncharacterized protein YaaR (DUF327 family)|nr:DUF327 family protein [Treponema sp.]
MAAIVFPDGSSPLFNPAAYAAQGESADARKTRAAGTDRGKKAAKKKGFASLFEKALLGQVRELPPSEDSLQELLAGVHSAGDALSRRPFPPEIQTYREAVRNFVHYVVENSFDTEEQLSGVNVLKRKKFTLVQVIDAKLESMAAAILRDQAGQLDILARLEEIKGLLVDLME